MKTESEFISDSKDSKNEVTEVPDNFKQWVEDNEERIVATRERGTEPYFLKDNAQRVDEILQSTNVATLPQYAELEKLLDIKQGAPMTFEEANEMRGNPHYSEAESYRINCQTCVVANELRRRGFPVEALANTKGSLLEELSLTPERAWVDANGNTPTPIRFGSNMTTKSNPWNGATWTKYEKVYSTRKQLVQAFESQINEDGRYHISWAWSNKKEGHIITLERINGVLRYYDPQNGEVIKDFVKYVDGISLKRGIEYYRVDNLMPNPDICSKILAKSGK
jgi:hypothetical protein